MNPIRYAEFVLPDIWATNTVLLEERDFWGEHPQQDALTFIRNSTDLWIGPITWALSFWTERYDDA